MPKKSTPEKVLNLKTVRNAKIEYVETLGEGGQGYVYKVLYNGKPMAMKVYKPKAIPDPEQFLANLKENMKHAIPSPAFLWPRDVIEAFTNKAGDTTFGYIMDLVPENYKSLSSFFKRKAKFNSFRTALDVALKITSAFRILHNAGYSYVDMNGDNFLIDPRTGDVLICDVDNIAPNGTYTGVRGTPRYMAPEIVRGDAAPSTYTDHFSLAVIIFMILTNSHPLEGCRYLMPCLTPDAVQELYGTNPVFILDPKDRSNAPVEGIHKNIAVVWNSLPKYMTDAFTKAFSKERLLDRPDKRLTDQVWEALLIRLRSDILPCPCGGETFIWDHSAPQCEDCKSKKFPVFPMLKLGDGCDYEMPLIPGAIVYRSQFGTDKVDTAGKPALRVVVGDGPDGRKSLFLHNISGSKLTCFTASGKRVPVDPGDPVPVRSGFALQLDSNNNKMITVL